jgi:hypothetical protein
VGRHAQGGPSELLKPRWTPFRVLRLAGPSRNHRANPVLKSDLTLAEGEQSRERWSPAHERYVSQLAAEPGGAAAFARRGTEHGGALRSSFSSAASVAILAVSDVLIAVKPEIIGWKGACEPFNFTAQALVLADDARRYELSTTSYCSAVGLSRSLALLVEAGAEALAEHSRVLAEALVAQVKPVGWTPFRALGGGSWCGHIVSLRHATLSASAVQAMLAAEYGVIVSSPGGGIRVSLHGYSDSSDVAIADALKELQSRGHRVRCALTESRERR